MSSGFLSFDSVPSETSQVTQVCVCVLSSIFLFPVKSSCAYFSGASFTSTTPITVVIVVDFSCEFFRNKRLFLLKSCVCSIFGEFLYNPNPTNDRNWTSTCLVVRRITGSAVQLRFTTAILRKRVEHSTEVLFNVKCFTRYNHNGEP